MGKAAGHWHYGFSRFDTYLI